ncbi:FeoA family protein [Algoriphagus namhaensis]
MAITADQLKPLTSGVIQELTNSPLKINLMELGFLPGKTITLTFAAPLGGPMAFILEGTVLALRRSEAALIQIQTA